jgi:hypothetical protein
MKKHDCCDACRNPTGVGKTLKALKEAKYAVQVVSRFVIHVFSSL